MPVSIEDKITDELNKLSKREARAILLDSVKAGMSVLQNTTKDLIKMQGYSPKTTTQMTKRVKNIKDSSLD